ncbi:MAG: ATPase, T2SS/T4P/T4SS family [Acidobacteria bacterium]|nr:ATPase, T2SS/T4P/T4SS family [Acidobacteriota bacterium]
MIFPSGITEGLVVVAGTTNCGKSRVLRNLIHRYLLGLTRCRPKRRPHLITFEDPVEVHFQEKGVNLDEARSIDYTPREKDKNDVDGKSLRECLNDALRQTPAAVYVGETRDKDDWKTLLDFAGTGHLVFTTCHAGSLQETIAPILRSTGSDTGASRSLVAARLVAAVHLRKFHFASNLGNPQEASVPTVWTARQGAGLRLVGSGLSSVLPDGRGCIGRTQFAQKLDPAASDDLLKQCLRSDLEGR